MWRLACLSHFLLSRHRPYLSSFARLFWKRFVSFITWFITLDKSRVNKQAAEVSCGSACIHFKGALLTAAFQVKLRETANWGMPHVMLTYLPLIPVSNYWVLEISLCCVPRAILFFIMLLLNSVSYCIISVWIFKVVFYRLAMHKSAVYQLLLPNFSITAALVAFVSSSFVALFQAAVAFTLDIFFFFACCGCIAELFLHDTDESWVFPVLSPRDDPFWCWGVRNVVFQCGGIVAKRTTLFFLVNNL